MRSRPSRAAAAPRRALLAWALAACGTPASRGKTSPEHKKKLNEITDYFVTLHPPAPRAVASYCSGWM